MNGMMEFSTRENFRKWLQENSLSNTGIWLFFGKPGGSKTSKAGEALEEALCFGWIDGRMQSIDAKTYKTYFSCAGTTANGRKKTKRWLKRGSDGGL